MKKVVLIIALVALSFASNVIYAKPSNAVKILGPGVVKLAAHFKYGDKCGIGTSCFIDKQGELQGWTITPRHIVIAHSINLGNGNTGKVRVYFIDRKTLKIVGMIPKQKDFSCNKLGNPGCYGHGSSLAYNNKTDKIWIGTREGYYQFNDQTMKYEKFLDSRYDPKTEKHKLPYTTSKLTYNQQRNFYWGGESEADVIFDKNFKLIKDTATASESCARYEEGPGAWEDYIVSNWYRPACGQPRLRFYKYSNNKLVKTFEIAKNAIHTEIIEQIVFLDDGTLLLGIPQANSLTKWGAGTAIYAISAKTLGIGKSTNTKIG